MILAAAQTIPKAGDISANFADHYRLTELAAKHGANLILFPELSLTGYEREKGESLAFVANDARLDELKKMAVEKQIIIVAGAPLRSPAGLFIGAFVLSPDHSEQIYTKQYLHDGEDIFYSAGSYDAFQIHLSDKRASLAICADITNPKHPARAAALHSTIYLASIFYTPNGISEGYAQLESYARNLSMNVLMSNFGGESYGYESAGRSAFWDNEGKLIGGFKEAGEGLVLVEISENDCEVQVLKTN